MNRTTLANIVKKLTELSKEAKKNLLKFFEEVNNGGGSSPGTNKSVSFEPQELTEEQQMQARKNQGLYYKEENVEYVTSSCPYFNDMPAEWSYQFSVDGASCDDLWMNLFFEGLSVDKFVGGSYTINPNFNRERGETDSHIDIIQEGEITITEDMIFPLQAEGGNAYGIGPDLEHLYIIVVEGIYDDDTFDWKHWIYVTYRGVTEEMVPGIHIYGSRNSSSNSISSITTVEHTDIYHPIPSEYTQAVSYSQEQDLTSSQQMQVRKNQGLYRTDVIPGGEIVWDGDTTGKDSFVDWRRNEVYCKIADGPLDINSRTLIVTEEGYDPITIKPSDWNSGGPGDLGYVFLNEGVITIFNNSSPYEADYNIISGTPPFTGIFATSKVRKIEFQDKEEVVLVEPKYLTNCIVIPFTKGADGNVTCDLSMEEFGEIIFNTDPSNVCPALNGVLGIPGLSRYYNENDDTESIVFAFQNFGNSDGELLIDDGGDEPKVISSQRTFNLAYTLLFVFEDGSVSEDNNYSVPLWKIRMM